MPVPSKLSASPISISSGDPLSPGAIFISSDSSPAGRPGILSLSQAPTYWPPMAANRHASVSDTGFGSRGSRASRSSVSTRDLGNAIEHELMQLREQCKTLQTENTELKGRVEALTMMYNHLVKKLANKIDRTRSDIKKIAANMPRQTPGPVEEMDHMTTPSQASPTIPSSLKKKDFPKVKHWTPDTWRTLRHRKGDTRLEQATGVPTLCQFWEDELGEIIPSARRGAVTRAAQAFWQQKHNAGVRLDTLTNIGLDLLTDFRNTMENEFPWLRLCDDHWKADQIWINHFSNWTPAVANSSTPAQAPQDVAGVASLKREHPTEQVKPGPSKRPKTADKENSPRVSRPKPKKTGAKANPFASVNITPATYVVPVSQNVANVPETTATPPTRSPALASNQVTPTPQPSENVPSVISTLGEALSLAASLPDNISGSPTPEFHPLPVHPRNQNRATPSTPGATSDAAHSESSAASSLTLSSTAEEPQPPSTPKPLRITGKRLVCAAWLDEDPRRTHGGFDDYWKLLSKEDREKLGKEAKARHAKLKKEEDAKAKGKCAKSKGKCVKSKK